MSVFLHHKECICKSCRSVGEVRVAMDYADTYYEQRKKNFKEIFGNNVLPFPMERTGYLGQLRDPIFGSKLL